MSTVKVVCTECGDPAEAHDVLHFKGDIKSGFCGPTVFSGECVICSWDCLNAMLDRGMPTSAPAEEPQQAPRSHSLRGMLGRPMPPTVLPEEFEEPEDEDFEEERDPPPPPPPPPPRIPVPPSVPAAPKPTGARRQGRKPTKRTTGASKAPAAPADVSASDLTNDVRELFETPKPTIKPGLPHSKEVVERNSSSSAEPLRAQLEASIRRSIPRETGE